MHFQLLLVSKQVAQSDNDSFSHFLLAELYFSLEKATPSLLLVGGEKPVKLKYLNIKIFVACIWFEFT